MNDTTTIKINDDYSMQWKPVVDRQISHPHSYCLQIRRRMLLSYFPSSFSKFDARNALTLTYL